MRWIDNRINHHENDGYVLGDGDGQSVYIPFMRFVSQTFVGRMRVTFCLRTPKMSSRTSKMSLRT